MEGYTDVHKLPLCVYEKALEYLLFDESIGGAVDTEEAAAGVDEPAALAYVEHTHSGPVVCQPYLQHTCLTKYTINI